jgi:hypothetical protein
MADEYPYTTGRMLHLEECPYFEPGSVVRRATPDELRTMAARNDCARNGGSNAGPARSPLSAVLQFTYPKCGLRKAIGQRAADGVCSDCAD